jgi:tetratricopeptide (TPR) repeat protein
MVLVKEGRVSEGIQSFRRSVELAPSFALAYYELGAALARSGSNQEARAALEKSISLQDSLPKNFVPDAYYRLSRVYMKLGDKEKAQGALATFNKLRTTEQSERQMILQAMQQAVDKVSSNDSSQPAPEK